MMLSISEEDEIDLYFSEEDEKYCLQKETMLNCVHTRAIE